LSFRRIVCLSRLMFRTSMLITDGQHVEEIRATLVTPFGGIPYPPP